MGVPGDVEKSGTVFHNWPTTAPHLEASVQVLFHLLHHRDSQPAGVSFPSPDYRNKFHWIVQ